MVFLPGMNHMSNSAVTVAVNQESPKTLMEGDILKLASGDEVKFLSAPSSGPVLDPTDPFESALLDIVRMNRRKRADYAADTDVFSNFRFTAPFTRGGPEWSAVFNVAQKLARLLSLAENGRLEAPENEAVEDTFLDLAVYAVIALAIYRQTKDD